MSSWTVDSVSVKNNEKDLINNIITRRNDNRTRVKSNEIISKYSVVGMKISEIPNMRNAIRQYVENINNYLESIDEIGKVGSAFKSKEIQNAIKDYVLTLKTYCINLISQLLAFSDKLADVANAWIIASSNIAGVVNSSSNLIDGIKLNTKNSNVSEANAVNSYINMTDKQKILVTKISYVDLNEEKVKNDLANGIKIKVEDLEKYLSNPNEPYLGHGAKIVTGINQTNSELIKEMKDSNLGDLYVVDVYNSSKTGLNVIVFEDEVKNKYFSFRGTDVNFSGDGGVKGIFSDVVTDVKEYLTDDNIQLNEAMEIYNKNKNQNGNNFLYGHSLAGNIVNNIYLKDSDNVNKAFVVNALPLSDNKIGNSEVFNNEGKYENIIIEGDWVSRLKGNNVIDNHILVDSGNDLNNNILSRHALESAMFDEKGNFVEIEKQVLDKSINAQVGVVDLVDSIGVKVSDFMNKNKN